MLWYNILWDNEGIISDLLQIDTISAGYVLLASNLVELKRENPDPILTVKIIEWRKLIDSFGLSIEADPSRAGKKNVYFPYWEYNKPFVCKDPHIKAPYVKIV